MYRQPRTLRRVLAAGLDGALRSAVLVVVVIVIAVPVIQLATQWYVRRSSDIFPSATAGAPNARDLVVKDATPAEARAIREAVSYMRFPIPLRGLTFVVAANPCPDCAGEYVPGVQTIRIEKAIADGGSLPLKQTIAHELGHFVDERFGTDAMRAHFRELRGIPPDLTWGARDRPWAERPVEDFAEVFAAMDLPLVQAPPATVYGPIRDPAAIQKLLAGVGVRRSRISEPMGWLRLVVLELSFLGMLVADPAFFDPGLLAIAGAATLGGLIGMWLEWRAD